MGEARALRGEGVLASLGLGSCVAIILHDAVTQVGAMAHVLLPSATLARDRTKPGKFPETAVPHLVQLCTELGAVTDRLRGRLVGGASMFANLQSPGIANMGERNAVACREALKAARIPLMATDTGKDFGRSVYLFVADGRVEVRSVQHGVWKV